MVIITADDYGKDAKTTNNILRCGSAKRISCASAMVFMDDSARAASVSKGTGMEFGLHLNLTAPFNSGAVPPEIRSHQTRIIRYLNSHSLAQVFSNPLLAGSFRTVFEAQVEEFRRLYGTSPPFYNGHHHMHLCANVLGGGLLPAGARIRGTFTFGEGEKGLMNRWYRRHLHGLISHTYSSTGGFFTIAPVSDARRICALLQRGRAGDIEIEVHPELDEETEFLLSDRFGDLLAGIRLCTFADLLGS
jgi:chitin disaccharide deacetylase